MDDRLILQLIYFFLEMGVQCVNYYINHPLLYVKYVCGDGAGGLCEREIKRCRQTNVIKDWMNKEYNLYLQRISRALNASYYTRLSLPPCVDFLRCILGIFFFLKLFFDFFNSGLFYVCIQ